LISPLLLPNQIQYICFLDFSTFVAKPNTKSINNPPKQVCKQTTPKFENPKMGTKIKNIKEVVNQNRKQDPID
jgi:hypothetical protein